jgi:hypothetical protein
MMKNNRINPDLFRAETRLLEPPREGPLGEEGRHSKMRNEAEAFNRVSGTQLQDQKQASKPETN